MNNYSNLLVKKYFEEQQFIDSDIENFNHFVEKELDNIIEENKDIEPTIIPHNIDEFKIKFDKIWVTKPEIIEADGSKRKLCDTDRKPANNAEEQILPSEQDDKG